MSTLSDPTELHVQSVSLSAHEAEVRAAFVRFPEHGRNALVQPVEAAQRTLAQAELARQRREKAEEKADEAGFRGPGPSHNACSLAENPRG
jgi:hypothetical protein